MDVKQIQKLEEVLLIDKSKSILHHHLERLTKPGDNFGSLMLSVNITVKTSDGTEEIKTVGKMVPPNEFVQKVFNTQQTFRCEIAFYKHVIPALQKFQKEEGMKEIISFTARYRGGRINLHDDESSPVDSDAILLLENLKYQNFIVPERLKGVDLNITELILKDLAYLHAVPIAAKLNNPEKFEENIKKYIGGFTFHHVSDQIEQVRKKIEEIPDCQSLVDRVIKGLQVVPDVTPREPFATVTHNDLWVNNIMVKYVGPTPIKTKLLDFQSCDYGSPARDLLFFLFSSVKNHIIEEKFDYLIEFYHRNFIGVLKALHCETASFSLKAFRKELEFEARNSQLYHTLMMLVPIFALKGTMTDIDKFSLEDMKKSMEGLTQDYFDKLGFIVKQWAQRNWI